MPTSIASANPFNHNLANQKAAGPRFAAKSRHHHRSHKSPLMANHSTPFLTSELPSSQRGRTDPYFICPEDGGDGFDMGA